MFEFLFGGPKRPKVTDDEVLEALGLSEKIRRSELDTLTYLVDVGGPQALAPKVQPWGPPAFIPLITSSFGVSVMGVWMKYKDGGFHWTFSRYGESYPVIMDEFARTEVQFFHWLLYKYYAELIDSDAVDEHKQSFIRLADQFGIRDYDKITNFIENSESHDSWEGERISVFATNSPLTYFNQDSQKQYDGMMPVLHPGAELGSFSTYELQESYSHYDELVSLVNRSYTPETCHRFLDEGNFEYAWNVLNEYDWKKRDISMCLKAFAEKEGSQTAQLIADRWLS